MPSTFYRNSKMYYQNYYSVSILPTGEDISKASINIADEIRLREREGERVSSFTYCSPATSHFRSLASNLLLFFPSNHEVLVVQLRRRPVTSSVFIRHLIVGWSPALLGDLAFRFNRDPVNFRFPNESTLFHQSIKLYK